MRKILTFAAVFFACSATGLHSAAAGLRGSPMGLRAAIEHIKFERPTIPPMAFLQFCIHYEGDCRKRIMFRGGPVELTAERWEELKEVNRTVNRDIIPEANELGLAGEKWLIGPERGDCNDYAVTKRHELLKRGWPARVLLLSEVVVPWGEHHLVLVVRTKAGDLLLDNLAAQIKPWSRAPYRWTRMQTPTSNMLWTTISDRGV